MKRDAEGFFSACRGRSGGALIPETIENREKMEGTGGETESETCGGKRRSDLVARARACARALSVDSRRSPKTVLTKKNTRARARARVSAVRARAPLIINRRALQLATGERRGFGNGEGNGALHRKQGKIANWRISRHISGEATAAAAAAAAEAGGSSGSGYNQ